MEIVVLSAGRDGGDTKRRPGGLCSVIDFQVNRLNPLFLSVVLAGLNLESSSVGGFESSTIKCQCLC